MSSICGTSRIGKVFWVFEKPLLQLIIHPYGRLFQKASGHFKFDTSVFVSSSSVYGGQKQTGGIMISLAGPQHARGNRQALLDIWEA